MSFAQEQSDRFAAVFDRSPYQSADPIVRIQHVSKGNNVVFGRTIEGDDHDNLIYVGKIYENTAGKNYLSADAWLDITFPHVIYITGTRGSGKSFDLGVLIEGISCLTRPSPVQSGVTPICSIVIDTQSQFWTLNYEPNPAVRENQAQLKELQRWNIRPAALQSCDLYVPPSSDSITGTEKTFQIRASDVKHEEWASLIGEEVYSPQGHVLGQAIEALAHQAYSLEDLVDYVRTDANWNNVPEASRNAVVYKLEGYRRTKLFAAAGMDVRALLKPSRCSVFLLRDLRSEDKALVTAIIARQLSTVMGDYHKRLKVSRFFNTGEAKEELPSKVWLFIDEAHVVAPTGEKSPATAALIDYVKRGRDAGLSLVMATQQPSAVDDRILSQVNVTFSHRLTFQADIQAAMNRIPTKLLQDLKYSGRQIAAFGDMLRFLEAGQCFIGDHNTSRTVMAAIRPRITSHGGYNPS
jgi:uncharacterized protein